jgi:glc operon protein GlcG
MSFSKAILGFTLGLFAAAASAQAPSYGANDVTLGEAKKIVAGSVAHAQKNKWPVAIAVVDRHGFLVYFERMDDTQTGSVDVALDKAKASAQYRRPTRAFEEGVAKGRVALLGLRGATPITGGVPIVVGGKITGAVGVSGVTADQDEEVAKAGLSGM